MLCTVFLDSLLTPKPTGTLTKEAVSKSPGIQTTKNTQSTLEIILYVFGALLFILLSFFLLWWIRRKRRRKSKDLKLPNVAYVGKSEQAQILLNQQPPGTRGRVSSSSSVKSTALFMHQRSRLGSCKLPQVCEVDIPVDENWEIDRNQLSFMELLGEGAFGRVVKAEAVGLPNGAYRSIVAVKMLKGKQDNLRCS